VALQNECPKGLVDSIDRRNTLGELAAEGNATGTLVIDATHH